MQEPPWMPRTEEEYRQQLAEDEAEEVGEALERQRQPENQPEPDLFSESRLRYRPQIYVEIGGVVYEDWG